MFEELAQLDEDRLTALDVLVRQKKRVTKAYNKRVKSKTFNEDDLVWKVILSMDWKDRILGKLSRIGKDLLKLCKHSQTMHKRLKS